MATVKKSTPRKAPTKKAAPKIVIAPLAEVPVETAPASTLTAADFVAIAKIATDAATAAVLAMQEPKQAPGGKAVKAKVYDTPHLTPEAIAGMSEEQIVEYNTREAARMAERKKEQSAALAKLGNLSTGDRKRALDNARDPSVIRAALPPGWDGDSDDLVRVICKRRVGLGNGKVSDLDEVIDVPREAARDMQSSGAIEVQI